MYCPKCAQPSTTDQKFCRHCGFSLQDVAPLLAGTPSTAESDGVRLERHLRKVISGAVLSIFLWILLLASLDIPGLHPTLKQIVSHIGIVCFGLSIGLSLYAGIRWWWLWQFGESTTHQQPQSSKLPTEIQTAELPPADAPERLLSEAHLEPVPSVTEHTTKLLTVERGGRAKEG